MSRYLSILNHVVIIYVVVIVSEDLPNSQSVLAQVLTHTSRFAGWVGRLWWQQVVKTMVNIQAVVLG